MSQVDLSHCFGCGPNNTKGLQLAKSYRGDRSHIEFDVRQEYASYPGMMHGGVTCVLFDEVMYYAVARLGIEAVTTDLRVRYHRPGLVGRRLICEAWVKGRQGRRVEVEATIVDSATGDLVAEAYGSFLQVDLERLIERS
jgi:uncharacterized protein (TIGR00369 family)